LLPSLASPQPDFVLLLILVLVLDYGDDDEDERKLNAVACTFTARKKMKRRYGDMRDGDFIRRQQPKTEN